ncbi:unnamed protein product, partial [Pelagomonas calceolata]
PRVARDGDARLIKKAHRGRLPDRLLPFDRFHRLPAPSSEKDALAGRIETGLAHVDQTPENHLGL